MRKLFFIMAGMCLSIQAQVVFMNETTNLTVGAGDTNIVVAQTGTGVVDKAGAGMLILQDPGLFAGTVRLREGSLSVEASGTAGAARPAAVFSRAAYHVDASDAASLTTNGIGAVSEWRDIRGAGYPTATPPGTNPARVAGALNGRPVVDFGPMEFYSGNVRGLHWSRELTNSVKSVFWVLGSQFGGGFLLGASDAYHFHRGSVAGPTAPLMYMYPEASVFRGDLPNELWTGETQIDRQSRNGRTTGLSGAFHLISLVATNAAGTGATAGRFANDRMFNAQSGGQSLAEVAVFEEVLTPEERDAVEAYLTDKWFRGPDLRVLELAGTGTVGRADSGRVLVNLLTGSGQLIAVNDVQADTVKLAGDMDLAGSGTYAIGLLRGAGRLTSEAPVQLANVGLYLQALRLDAEVEGGVIGSLYGGGSLTLGGGVAFDRIQVGGNITVTNDGTGLEVADLSGIGTLNVAACGALAVDTLQFTNSTLIVNSGTNAVSIGALSGNGTLQLQTSGAVTIGDVAAFTGILSLDNCGPVEILGPSGDKALAGLTVVGTANLTVPGGVLKIGRLYGRGTLTVTNVLEVSALEMTANLTVNDAGTGPLMLESIKGPGTLTLNRPYYAPAVTLIGGSQVVTLGLSNRVEQVSGSGTLNVPAGAFAIGTLSLGGTVTFNNGGQPLAVSSLSGSGRLTATGSALTLGAVTVADLQTLFADVGGTASVSVAALNGHGVFRKGGSGDFTFPVPVTLRNLAVEGGTLHPVRDSAATIPASVVPAFWVDASQAGDILTNAQGGVTQWWDVRKSVPEDSWMYAYSENAASAPGVLEASANGLPVVAFGQYQSGHYLRWSAQVDPVRTFFMALGTHEGGGYLLGCTTTNDFIRSSGGGGSYRMPLWNTGKIYTRFGRTYVDGEPFAPDQAVPFNGGYQVLSFVDDTTESNNPTLLRGRADQFARYMTVAPLYTGGQRLGEVLICTNVVTEAERAAIEKYLSAKWVADIRRLEVLGESQMTLGAGETLSVDVACGAGRLVKEGEGNLKVSNAALLAGGLTVKAGRLAFARTDRVEALDPIYHVDASAANGSVMTNPYGYVTNWADVRFNGRYAEATNATDNAPNLLLNAVNGRPVVDFNYYNYYGSTAYGSLRYLCLTQEISTIRTAFWLLGSQLGGGFLLGHSTKYDFHRGAGTAGDSYAPALFSGSASAFVRDGRIFVDGAKLDSPYQQNVLNGGYQLIQLVTTGNASANQFSHDRVGSQCGGQRLGEVVLYNYPLTEKERMNMEALLSSKWFGDLRQVSLADGTELNTGGGTAAVSIASLAGSGTVRREGDATLRLFEASGFSGVLETRLDRLDVSRKAAPPLPAPNPVLWLDAARAGGVSANGTVITNIRDFSSNSLPIGLRGGNPTLLPGELNGHPVVDMGPCFTGGKALTFDGTRAPVLSAVAVHGSQEGGGNFLGAKAPNYPFYREGSKFLGTRNPYTPLWYASNEASVRLGWTYLDGQNLNGVVRGFTGGYGLFSFVLKPRAPLTTPYYIAGDRETNPQGGLRFGEILLYDRVLSDDERQQTEAYLNAKWFGRASTGYAAPTLPVVGRVRSLGGALQVAQGQLAVIGEISGVDEVPVTGGGRLALTSGGAAPASYSVTSGTLTLSPSAELKAELPVTDGLAFWVDASKAESLTFKSGSATQVVQWADARGAGYPHAYAYADPAQRYTNLGVAVENRIPGGIAITPPTLLPAALNGLPVLDFGTYNSTQWLLWSTTVTGIRSVFWVIGSQNGGGNLMSGSDDINYFIRGTNYIVNTPRVLWGGNWLAITNGVSRIDGMPVNGLKTGLNGTGHQVVSLVTANADPSAGAFAADRPGRYYADGTRCGGQRLAEVLVYTRALSDAERAGVEAYLTWKWFGRGTPGTTFAATAHSGATVDLAPDAELILNGVARGDVAVTGNGYVAGAAVPPTVYQLTGPRVFSQGLILADGAKIMVDYNGAQPLSDRVSVIGGLAVEGDGQVVMSSVVNWSNGTQTVPLIAYDTVLGGELFHTLWSGSGAPFMYSLNPGWAPAANQLEAVLSPSATLLFLR